MRVLVTGGRDFEDRQLLVRVLNQLHEVHKFALLIHGGAKGADQLAGEWGAEHNIPVMPLPANWKRHGRAAGPIRNRQMLEHRPDLLIAFPGGKGTADMVRASNRAGIRVVLVTDCE